MVFASIASKAATFQALLRELAAFNTGLCVITTRLPVADLANPGSNRKAGTRGARSTS